MEEWMSHKIWSLCGMISPVLFVSMTILGGALRPGYSHIADTVSELFSPGAPNKRLLDVLHTTTAVLTVLFGVGVWRLVGERGHGLLLGRIGAGMIVTMGLVNVATATVFPQDAWGSDPTFPGEMHKILAGVLALLSIASTLLLGIWVRGAQIFPGFGIYSFISVGLIVLTGGFAVTQLGSPIMGLTERITILAGLQWTFALAFRMFTR
jgi:hypothetical protein